MQDPATVFLKEFLPGTRPVALNELRTLRHLQGALPLRKWHAATAPANSQLPFVPLLGASLIHRRWKPGLPRLGASLQVLCPTRHGLQGFVFRPCYPQAPCPKPSPWPPLCRLHSTSRFMP